MTDLREYLVLKKVFNILLKLGVIFLFVNLTISGLDLGKTMSLLCGLDPLRWIAGWFLIGLALIIAACRWQLILWNAGFVLGLWEVVRLTYIGAFFSTFLPGATGGDVAKGFYMWKLHGERTWDGAATVLIDRAIGFCSLFAIASICLCVKWFLMPSQKYFDLIAGVLFALTACGVAFLYLLFYGRSLLKCLRDILPYKFQNHRAAVRLGEIYNAVGGRPYAYVPVLLVSVLSQLFLFIGAYLVSIAMVASLSLLSWLVYFPVILAASVLPISFSGVGVREYLFVLFAGVLAFPSKEAALGAALLVFTSMLLQNALGGVVYLISRASQPPRGREI